MRGGVGGENEGSAQRIGLMNLAQGRLNHNGVNFHFFCVKMRESEGGLSVVSQKAWVSNQNSIHLIIVVVGCPSKLNHIEVQKFFRHYWLRFFLQRQGFLHKLRRRFLENQSDIQAIDQLFFNEVNFHGNRSWGVLNPLSKSFLVLLTKKSLL